MPQTHLTGEVMHQLSRDQLVHILESIHGPKDLYIDPLLMKPLDRIAGAALLRRHGVEKMFRLERASPPLADHHRVYLVRPNLVLVKYICDQINSGDAGASDAAAGPRFHIVFTPKVLHACRVLLEEEGVLGVAQLHQYSFDFVALDDDLWSLEMPEFYRSFFLDGSTALLEPVARAVWGLQTLCGLIPRVHAHGRAAQQVVSLLEFYRSEWGDPGVREPEVGHLVVLDRDVDPAAALLSQLTYSGVVDETFGIRCGVLELTPEVTGTEPAVKLMMHSRDQVYRDIRDLHFSAVVPVLKQRSRQLQSHHAKRREMTTEQMKAFVQSELKDVQAQHKSLAAHIGACEVIMKRKTRSFEDHLRAEHSIVDGLDMRDNLAYIEQSLARQEPALTTLRLMCLYSLAQDGVPTREYQALTTQLLHSHGFHHLVTLQNLKRLGLLTELSAAFPTPTPAPTAQLAQKVAQSINLARQSAFKTVTRKLQLIPDASDSYDLRVPPDAGYVFSGAYIPVACALLRLLLTDGGWTAAPAEAALRLLPGRTVARAHAHRLIVLTTAVVTGNTLLEGVA
ncbi:vacuolar protein sorting-associated protein 33B-like [Pollicipes pollicipes]|uniref:vacuolar protein sorting-associated protein 33B-like n=1 Tax=Pollicipes pollicipes TaxID=41117 RepID=UPI0018853C4E|nr:vacuolar protein sorting-associated protein 33B-like [Pollicipes pollicipes]